MTCVCPYVFGRAQNTLYDKKYIYRPWNSDWLFTEHAEVEYFFLY